MAIIRFSNLPMADAEEVIAEIWSCLEEYDIPTPEMEFSFAPTTVSMQVRTRESRWDFALALRLSARGGVVLQPKCVARARKEAVAYRGGWTAAPPEAEGHRTRARP
jgi:hypothetical protein